MAYHCVTQTYEVIALSVVKDPGSNSEMEVQYPHTRFRVFFSVSLSKC